MIPLVAVSFFLLAPYIAVEAIRALAAGDRPQASIIGLILTAGTAIFEPALGVAKRRIGTRLGSSATAGEGTQNLLCAYLAMAVFAGLAASTLWGAWWLDGVVALGIASAFAAFYAGQAILAGTGIQARIGDPQALRSVLGAGLYLAVLDLLALGLGTLIRRTAGAAAAVTGLVIILPVLVQGLPPSWQDAITRYLPSAAGQAIIGRTKFASSAPPLWPWPGFALGCAYAAAVLIAAGIVLNRRDT